MSIHFKCFNWLLEIEGEQKLNEGFCSPPFSIHPLLEIESNKKFYLNRPLQLPFPFLSNQMPCQCSHNVVIPKVFNSLSIKVLLHHNGLFYIPLLPQALSTLSSISHGDLRRAITYLQVSGISWSTHSIFEHLSYDF